MAALGLLRSHPGLKAYIFAEASIFAITVSIKTRFDQDTGRTKKDYNTIETYRKKRF